MDKKEAGSSKQHMSCEMKAGKNLVIELSTAAFEMAKACISKILGRDGSTYHAESKDAVETQGLTVDTCVRVFNKKLDGSKGKLQKKIINFYHTSSQILVNGSRVDQFVDDVFPLKIM
ncbi:MAG: hypothetical protein ABW185_00660 [Sedimenticola sp.]